MQTINHIGIYVDDLAVSKAFYTEILGCTVVEEMKHPEMTLCFLEAGGTQIELIDREDFTERPQRGAIDHLAFTVPALDPMIELLNARGVELLSEPRQVGIKRILFFKGPNNERFEFVEYLEK